MACSQCSLVIKSFTPAHAADPSCEIYFEFENRGWPQVLLLPSQIRLQRNGRLVASGALWFADAGRTQLGLNERYGTKAVLAFSPATLTEINQELESRPSGQRDVVFDVYVDLMLLPLNHSRSPPVEGFVDKWSQQYTIPESEWLKFMRRWNAPITPIWVSSATAEALQQLKETGGFAVEGSVIAELVRKATGAQASLELVSETGHLGSTTRELIESSKRRLFIMCRALDKTFENELKTAVSRGVDVRVLSVPLATIRARKERSEPSRLEAAQSALGAMLNWRVADAQHARVIVSDDAVLIGSSDPDYVGINEHLNAGIFVKDNMLADAAAAFFVQHWDSAKPV